MPILTDDEKLKTKVALLKWVDGENLAAGDIERIIAVFDTCPLNLEILDQGKAAALLVRMRSVIAERFMPKG